MKKTTIESGNLANKSLETDAEPGPYLTGLAFLTVRSISIFPFIPCSAPLSSVR